MAKRTKNVEVELNPAVNAEFTTASKLALNAYSTKARELGDTMSEGGVQMTIAVMGFVGSQRATKSKEKFDFNKDVFCPWAARYYRPGMGGKREKLDGFNANGNHDKGSSALTQLRGYMKFVDAGKLKVDAKPLVVSILGDPRIGSLSLGRKGKLLEDILAKVSNDTLPGDDVVEKMKAAEIPSKSKTVDAVKAIKSLASAADRVATMNKSKFWAALDKLENPKASRAIAHAMFFLAAARAAVDSGKQSTEKNKALDALLSTHAAAEYKLAVKTGASVH